MASTWLLRLAFLIYPLIIFRLNKIIRQSIPDKSERIVFKKEKEYIIKLVYLITPLLLLHAELIYLNAGYSFTQINTLSLVVLFSLQVILLFKAVNTLFQLFADLKKYKE